MNPNAGGLRRGGALVAIRSLVEGRGRLWVTKDEADLERVASEVVGTGASVVLFVGGDGTYYAGVTALHRASRGAPLPPMAFARAGTVSIVARNWGSAPNALGAVTHVLGSPAAWRITPRPTLEVTENDGPSRIGFTFGTGLVANFFEEYDKAGARGNAAAALLIARLFAGGLRRNAFSRRVLEPVPCRLVVEGTMHSATAWSLVLASVLKDVGLHHHVAHRAGEDLVRPHVVATTLRTRDLVLNWPRVLFGKGIADPSGVDRLVSEIQVQFTGGAGPYVLDGDTFRAETVTVRAGPTLTVVT